MTDSRAAAHGAQAAVAIVARAALEYWNGVLELADEVLRSDHARETLASLASVAAGFAGACADFRGLSVPHVLDDLALVATNAEEGLPNMPGVNPPSTSYNRLARLIADLGKQLRALQTQSGAV